MAESASYAILGRGRWASKMNRILSAEGRRTIAIPETRSAGAEAEADYVSRLSSSMLASGAEIAWLCVPPGPHIPLMVEAALCAGLHVVIEKPWLCSHAETDSLAALARARHLVAAVHYQYCFFEEVECWRCEFKDRTGLRFGGRFTVNRADRLGLPAIDNLGCHLLAIRAYAAPRSAVAEIDCGYDRPDQRRVWIEAEGKGLASIDLLSTAEPVIQRFAHKLEASLAAADFQLDLRFALRVSDAIDALKRR